MKDELKTLKDLDSNQIGFYRNIDEVEVFKNELKAEAVKWVKHEEKGWFQHIDGKEYNCSPVLISWIKNFFNLTEENLK